MTSRERKAGGDFILESRHLVGLFFLLVVIFGVVFTLGYLLGRRQYDSGLRAENTKADSDLAAAESGKGKHKPDEVETLPSEKNSDWDFYHSAEPKTTEDHLQPPPKIGTPAKPATALKTPGKSSTIVASNNLVTKTPTASAKSATAPKPPENMKASAPLNGPLIPKGNIMLQVAALQRQEDALALAQALQQKKFPAIVITPGADKYYRVQVGPYADAKTATIARQDLEAKGFKSIIKR